MLVSLNTMKNDLDRSADHFERLSAVMVGYLIFITGRQAVDEVEAIIECLKGIETCTHRLRRASSKIPLTGAPNSQPAP